MDDENPFTHILCDFYLPDGTYKDVHAKIFGASSKLPESFKAIPLIVSSARVAEEDLEFIKTTSTDFLAKPFSITKMLEMLNKYDTTKDSLIGSLCGIKEAFVVVLIAQHICSLFSDFSIGNIVVVFNHFI